MKPKLDKFIIERVTGLSGHEAVSEFVRQSKNKNENGSINAEHNEIWTKWLIGKGEAGYGGEAMFHPHFPFPCTTISSV